MKSQEPKPLSISVTVLHHAASATKLLYFMKEKSFNSEVMKNSLPTATENIMNCGMHRRNIIQRKISKMPLAQIFFVGAGGISSIPAFANIDNHPMLCHSIVSSSLYLNQLMFMCFSRLKLCNTSINHCKIFCIFRSFYQLIVLLQAHQYNIFLHFTGYTDLTQRQATGVPLTEF